MQPSQDNSLDQTTHTPAPQDTATNTPTTMPTSQPKVNTLAATPTIIEQPKKVDRKILFVVLAVVLALIAGGATLVTSNKSAKQTLDSKTSSKQATNSSTTEKQTSSNTEVSDEAKITATANTQAIRAELEAYFIQNDYYPAELKTAYFPNADPSAFTMPANTTLTYTPGPSGCTTIQKNCTAFTLTAKQATGATFITLDSL